MTRIIAIITLVYLLFTTVELMAQEPPTPQEVADTIINYWLNQEFINLSSYVTNLYVAHSNYFPAIMASEFHDYIFLGKINDASNKLNYVYNCITNTPQFYPENFRWRIEQLFHNTKEIMTFHINKGRTFSFLQSNASPSTIRSTWGTNLPPQIEILFYTPATNAP